GAELHFFGGPIPDVPALEGVLFHGAFRPEDLPRLCAEIDVAVIPSVFPETYCLVLSEVWMGGLPVAASGLGALGERVEEGVSGKKFRPGDPSSIAEALCWFLEQDWRRWQVPRPRTLDAMLADYDALYQEVLGRERAAPAPRPARAPELLVVQ